MKIFLLSVAALSLFGCVNVEAPIAAPAAPPVAVAAVAPAPPAPPAVPVAVRELGVEMFEDSCVKCHGFKDNVAPTLVGVTARLDYETFTQTVRAGRNRMPAHPMIKDDELRAIWAIAEAGDAIMEKTRAGEGCGMAAHGGEER
jgi:mono/diheme cytochrome c family protein